MPLPIVHPVELDDSYSVRRPMPRMQMKYSAAQSGARWLGQPRDPEGLMWWPSWFRPWLGAATARTVRSDWALWLCMWAVVGWHVAERATTIPGSACTQRA